MSAVAVTAPEAGASRLPRFLLLLAQLVGIIVAVRLWNIESTLFADLVALSVLGFAIHYWLPAVWRYRFFVGYSIACAFVIELLFLGGRARLDAPSHSLLKFD